MERVGLFGHVFRYRQKVVGMGHSVFVSGPVFKQFSELTEDDFRRHPVWISCHVADYDEPWYDETDEESFRPYDGPLPADPGELLLVQAAATLRDGTRGFGFMSPSDQPGDLSSMQPHLFVGGVAHGFWGGIVGIREAERDALCSSLDKVPDEVFPIRFVMEPSLVGGVPEIEVIWWAQYKPDYEPKPGHRWRRRG